ncbi:MAG: hypothetical protein E7414_01830 [Ruminococcaceae bacterium]|nr:hypothetical protein [Oscillospiraceae bacterium]
MSLFYRIAGLTIECEDCLDAESVYQLSFYKVEPVAEPDIRFTFHFGCTGLQAPEGTLLAEVNKRYWYRRSGGGYAFFEQADEISPEILNLMVASAGFRTVEAWFCPPELLHILGPDKRPYHLISEVLKYALLYVEGFIIHASSLAYQNQGVLFSAPSGTGKSTHTTLWKHFMPETVIVNDDMPIVRIMDGVPQLCGAPWSGKSSIHTNVCVPLRAIVFLERGEVCSLIPMDPMEAVWRMYDAVRQPVMPELAEACLGLIGELMKTVPVYLLRCDISKKAVETAMQVIR